MISHFANDIENTVGTKLELEGEEWALFLPSNNTSFFTEFHLIIFGLYLQSLLAVL